MHFYHSFFIKQLGWIVALLALLLTGCGGSGNAEQNLTESEEELEDSGSDQTASGSWQDIGESVLAGTLSRSRLVVDDAGQLYSLFMTSNGVHHLYKAEPHCSAAPCWASLNLEEQQDISIFGIGPGGYAGDQNIPLIGLADGVAISFNHPDEDGWHYQRRVIGHTEQWDVLAEDLELAEGSSSLGSVHAVRAGDALVFATANSCGIKLHRVDGAEASVVFDGPAGFHGGGTSCDGSGGPESWRLAATNTHLYVTYLSDGDVVLERATFDVLEGTGSVDWAEVAVLTTENGSVEGLRLAANGSDVYLMRRLAVRHPDTGDRSFNAALFHLDDGELHPVGGVLAADNADGIYYFDLHLDSQGRPLVAWTESFTFYYSSSIPEDDGTRLYFERLEGGQWTRLGGGDISAFGDGISRYVASAVHGTTPYIQFRGNAADGTTGRDLRVMRYVAE